MVLQYAAKGQDMLVGLVILFCAMVIDRIIQGSYRKKTERYNRELVSTRVVLKPVADGYRFIYIDFNRSTLSAIKVSRISCMARRS